MVPFRLEEESTCKDWNQVHWALDFIGKSYTANDVAIAIHLSNASPTLIDILLRMGHTDPEIIDSMIIESCRQGHIGTLKDLLKHTNMYKKVLDRYNTYLRESLEHRQEQAIEILLDDIRVPLIAIDWSYYLRSSIKSNLVEATRLFLRENISSKIIEEVMIEVTSTEMMSLLLSDARIEKIRTDVLVTMMQRSTDLALLVLNDPRAIVSEMSEEREVLTWLRPFSMAAQSGDLRLILALVDHPRIFIYHDYYKDYDGYMLETLCEEGGDIEHIKFILSRGKVVKRYYLEALYRSIEFSRREHALLLMDNSEGRCTNIDLYRVITRYYSPSCNELVTLLKRHSKYAIP